MLDYINAPAAEAEDLEAAFGPPQQQRQKQQKATETALATEVIRNLGFFFRMLTCRFCQMTIVSQFS